MATVSVPIEASANDQSAFRDDTVWPPATSVNRSQAFVTIWAQKTFSTPNYRSRNILLRFNTGNYIPDGATINSATLEMVPQFVSTVNSKTLRIRWYDWDGALDSDHTNADSDTGGNQAHDGVAAGDFTTDVLEQISLLNAPANVSTTGVTELRLTLTGGQPTGTNDFNFHSFDNTLSFQVPTLVVDYTPTTWVGRTGPDGIAARQNLTGSVSAVSDDPDAPDGNWLVVG